MLVVEMRDLGFRNQVGDMRLYGLPSGGLCLNFSSLLQQLLYEVDAIFYWDDTPGVCLIYL